MNTQNNQGVGPEQKKQQNAGQCREKDNSLWILIGMTVFLFLVSVGSYSYFIGSGNIVSKDFSVSEFQSINLEASGNIYLTQDEQQSVRIEAEDKVFKLLTVNVENGKLTISLKRYLVLMKPIKIYISMKEIENLEIGGSGSMVGQSKINADTLKLLIEGSGSFDLDLTAKDLNTSIIGSGKLDLNGSVDNHNAEIEGSGNIKAFELLTETSDIEISGSGNAEIYASKQLDIDISGSGNVFYKGEATVTQEISGSGNVKKR
ncbi:MAG: DUF2807 domain-containing protein [Candidatus Pacebacteria bacterium]|nr:DUF2807 domain-containing protein [Candidatus Paceibacterota bacterium]